MSAALTAAWLVELYLQAGEMAKMLRIALKRLHVQGLEALEVLSPKQFLLLFHPVLSAVRYN